MKKKTDEVHAQIAKSEWILGMYFDKKLGPVMPTNNLRAAIAEGGKFNKLGASIKRCVMVMSELEPVRYKGPRDPEKMWNQQAEFVDCRSVVKGGSRVMCYRPRFEGWTVQTEFTFDPEQINREQLITAAEQAGRFVGLGDFRPDCGGWFGRFDIEVVK